MLYLIYLTRKPGSYRENKARGSGYPFGHPVNCAAKDAAAIRDRKTGALVRSNVLWRYIYGVNC